MSTDRYFDKFPIITYSNNQVVDITKRVTLLDRVSINPYVFYPYDIVSDERADQFSSRYYEDSYKSWILYLSNKINDPYYEWYLTEEEFTEYIELKYGSLYNAQQKTKYYRNNWESQDNLTVSGYNALSVGMKKYWSPVYSSGSTVLSYERKQIDWTSSTNRVMSYAVSNTAFIKDEIVDIYLDGSSYGRGQVANISNNNILVHHVSGFYQELPGFLISNGYVYGTESNVNTSVTDATVLSTNIPDDEFVYWKAYSYHDYEVERNEFNRSLRVLDKDYMETAVNNLTELLEE